MTNAASISALVTGSSTPGRVMGRSDGMRFHVIDGSDSSSNERRAAGGSEATSMRSKTPANRSETALIAGDPTEEALVVSDRTYPADLTCRHVALVTAHISRGDKTPCEVCGADRTVIDVRRG